MSNETERIAIPISLSSAIPTCAPAKDRQRVEYLEAVLADIASAARMLAQWVDANPELAIVARAAQNIITLADNARPVIPQVKASKSKGRA